MNPFSSPLSKKTTTTGPRYDAATHPRGQGDEHPGETESPYSGWVTTERSSDGAAVMY
jgi:hypothetical protein